MSRVTKIWIEVGMVLLMFCMRGMPAVPEQNVYSEVAGIYLESREWLSRMTPHCGKI